MFADKAQLAHYESTRAQFESFAANGWDSHKMTIYWMLNSHWPSFFGNIFDYYLRPGGAYYGAKKGLRPLSVVFDSYATGDHRQGKVSVVNQSPEARSDLRVRVRTYDLGGRLRDDRAADGIDVDSGAAAPAMTLPPGAGRLPGVLRPLRTARHRRRGAGRERLLAVPASPMTSVRRPMTRRSTPDRSAGPI